ncbi:MAG: HAMP domain-containing histidine kinase [Verrucomicrobiales bacterium]|nr:HAMP domain-containing histidine kinase [Verrucomicrobiales bacterium]MCP5559466.1 HAMP domain-containing histidine kinase [Verrucomicrobiaceae bacterium]
MSLLDGAGRILYLWGQSTDLAGISKKVEHGISGPLSGWRIDYTPSEEEVPQAYLFPIALGMGSGIILVIALAWVYFSESSRELDEAKARVSFVNQVSHELRTPLTNIRLYAEMAAHRFETAGDGTGLKQLAVVESESARLGRLIQNVLAFARQQRDRLDIQPQDLVLDEVVRRVVENWKPALQKKQIEIEVECHGPPLMRADLDAIEQILGNLLSNVEKYGAGGRWVRISTNVAQGRAVVRVRDRGPGIPVGKQKVVFEPFERLRSDLNEGVSGTGIGLTISRELAELHGGTLGIETGQTQGACFILALPLTPIHNSTL